MDQNKQFLSGLHKKKKNSWKKLYELYYPSLCNYVSRLIKNEADAADIVQRVFIRMWEMDLSFVNIETLTAYLYKAVRNSSITYIEQQKTDKKRLELFSLENISENDLDDSMILMIEEEMIRELYNCIAKLPKQQAEIITLSGKGMTVRQVAEKLGVSVNTIKTQKKRAYAFLKKKLNNSLFLLLLMSV